MNIIFIIFICIFIIIVFLCLVCILHPYSIFLFFDQLINYKTVFEDENKWDIFTDWKLYDKEIIEFLQNNGYDNIDYLIDDNRMLKYVFPTTFSKDNSYFFIFFNKQINQIGGLCSIIKLNDNKKDVWYLDHICINKHLRKNNYQNEILIYIYQYFEKNINKNSVFLIQKAGKPSKFLFPYNFKTEYLIISFNQLKNIDLKKYLSTIKTKYEINNKYIIINKLKQCYVFQTNNGFNTYWFSYPNKNENKNTIIKKRMELVYWENSDIIKTDYLLPLNNEQYEYLIPKSKNYIENKNELIYRFWYLYPFNTDKMMQYNSIFVSLQ